MSSSVIRRHGYLKNLIFSCLCKDQHFKHISLQFFFPSPETLQQLEKKGKQPEALNQFFILQFINTVRILCSKVVIVQEADQNVVVLKQSFLYIQSPKRSRTSLIFQHQMV